MEMENDGSSIETEDDIIKSYEEKEGSEDASNQSEDLTKEIEELKSSLQRLQADFINYKRRVEKEKEQISIFANEKIMTELLPVIDNLERAMDSCKEEEKESSIFSGVELVQKQLIDSLGKFGLERICDEGCDFDPNFHHAVMQEEVEGVDSEKIVAVFQKGYKLSEKVIRPSMVKVSK
ncbi:molecular chaperone GrpE [Peptoclostridium litorale DSM 5388]|uniref:Protein GrpE n=2 Tax=Peptoclostridium litorale TaxID=1557 RepID=A0A069RLI8_PEPLI|nr:protein GrpE [Peptoclostridium litorale DSM 5388]SIN75716.1 molecular chaperone GrpE [Peptoclostridium litorale DSM 5388]